MHASPHFPDVQKKLNDNHLVAFIIAQFDIKEGEELLWKYDISQGYRRLEPPPTPSPVSKMSIKKKNEAKSGQGAAKIMRCAGCECKNPCPSLKNCLTVQILPRKRTAVEKENFAPSKQDRIEGCLCKNPCPSLKNCLTVQILPRKRTAVEKENFAPSKQDRIEGCLCKNPCPSLKNCLTPQESLKSRPRTVRRLDD
jgi:hypothetical protein